MKNEKLQGGPCPVDSTEYPAPNGGKTETNSVKVGDYIAFGSYPQGQDGVGAKPIEWQVLDVKDGRALLISMFALDCKPYHEYFGIVSWEDCSLRAWLNSVFLRKAFTADEQARIADATVSADINPEYRSDQGCDTVDKVFLLSTKEAERYFASDEERRCVMTAFAVENGGYMSLDGFCWWLLRTVGRDGISSTLVDDYGKIAFTGGRAEKRDRGVRPAIWIKLEQ